MNQKKGMGLGLAALIVTTAGYLIAADAPKSTNAMTPDPAMAQAMMLGTPNEHHKVLDPLAGRWSVTVKGWMKPGDQAQESKGTAEHVWIMGGRYLKQEFKGEWAGQPFEGLGFSGYDNVRQEYQTTWLDSMATGMMHVSGSYDPVTKTLKQSGNFACPMTGEKDRYIRSEWKMTSSNSNTYTSYFKGPDGKEFKGMEIVYTRMK